MRCRESSSEIPVKPTYVEIEAVGEVDIVCGINPPKDFWVKSSRDAEIAKLIE